MKFATCTLAFDQGKWIMRALANAYPHVDRIYVMHSKLPWNYNENARGDIYLHNTLDIDNIRNSIYKDKIVIIEGDWNTEIEERNECRKIAIEDGFDFLMVHDADEFYFHKDFEIIKEAIANNPQYDCYLINWYVFWKSFNYIVLEEGRGKFGGQPQIVLNLHSNKEYSYLREITTDNKALITDAVCYHASYVLTDEEAYKKIKTWGHANDFDADKWYNEVWLPWTPDSKNLHPLRPKVWPKVEEYNDLLPEVIKDLTL